MSQLFHFLKTSLHLITLSVSHIPKYNYIVFALMFLYQYILVLPTKVIAVQTSETILQRMVLQCFNKLKKKQRLLPQKCAFACNCWFAFPYFTSFVVSVEHTPMWSSFLCLSMIRQYVTAVMIRSLTVRAASCLRLLSRLRQMLPGSPCWETDEACDSTGLCECVCYTMRGTMVIWWRKRGYQYILRWKVSLPSCACACVCGCGRVCVDMRLWACCAGRWHYCIAGPPWLTGGGQGEGGKGGEDSM